MMWKSYWGSQMATPPFLIPTSKRDRALFIRCTAEERQEIKIKLNILKENLKCQTLVETVLVLIEKEISKNK